MGEGMLQKLALKRKFDYEFDGLEPFQFEYKLLTTRDMIDVQNYEPKEDSMLYMILISVQDYINDNKEAFGIESEVTVDDIKDLPAFITDEMLKDILEFNNYDINELKEQYEKSQQ